MDNESRAPLGATAPQPPKPPKKANWIRRHKKLAIILGIVLVLLLAGGGYAAWYFLLKPDAEPVKTQTVKKPAVVKPAEKFYGALTGIEVADKAAVSALTTGVMIENSPDARPQSGLKNSGVVFEAIAEGGITRFLVLYQTEKPQMIGPVRSVRLYDVDWLRPFNAGLAHVGGSAEALTEIRNGNYRDFDQFFNSGSYWRATDRFAPHNVYTNFENLDALNAAKGYTDSVFTGFTRKDSAAVKTPTASSLDVTISSYLYNSTYVYNAESNTYDRFQGGEAHLDREDGQISPRVVIVLKVNQETILQDGYREKITTIGDGQAYIFQDGAVTEATWHKSSIEAQMTFTDVAGKDVPLARGQTWITAVPNDTGGVRWQ